MPKQRPCNARVLVGLRDDGDVGMSSAQQTLQPAGTLIRRTPWTADHGARTVYEEGSQIPIAALADAQQQRFASTRMLSRHQTDPGSELSAIGEMASVSDRSHQCTRRQ